MTHAAPCSTQWAMADTWAPPFNNRGIRAAALRPRLIYTPALELLLLPKADFTSMTSSWGQGTAVLLRFAERSERATLGFS